MGYEILYNFTGKKEQPAKSPSLGIDKEMAFRYLMDILTLSKG